VRDDVALDLAERLLGLLCVQIVMRVTPGMELVCCSSFGN